MERQLVLVRHGAQEPSLNGPQCWSDAVLLPKGQEEVKNGGKLLKSAGFKFSAVFTSTLKRAVESTQIILDEAEFQNDSTCYWQLNVPHCGAFSGLTKTVEPGAKETTDHSTHFCAKPGSPNAAALAPETPDEFKSRIEGFLKTTVYPALKQGNVLVVSHLPTMRVMLQILAGMSESEAEGVEMPNGIPLVLDLVVDERIDVKNVTLLK